jgi:NADH-quinone oxidoreductase subunit A
MCRVQESLARFAMTGPPAVQSCQCPFVMRHCPASGPSCAQHSFVRHDQAEEYNCRQRQPICADRPAPPGQPRQYGSAEKDQQPKVANGAVPPVVSGDRAAAGLQSLRICPVWIVAHAATRSNHDIFVAMPRGYIPIFIFLAIAIAFPVVTIIIAKLIRPSSPFATKLEAYECGIKAASDSRGRYTVRFYIIAILFVIFDVETIFLFPWAVRYKSLGWFGVAEVVVFLLILVVGYIWAYKKGALEWV